MNILMAGGDTKGSWQMRGLQLGKALGARCTSSPSADDWKWADLVVLVKRAAIMWAEQARACGKPVVWDVLDFWAQPEDNQKTREELIAQVRQIQQSCGAGLLIGATRAMAEDIGGVYLPHHSRIGLTPTPPRSKAEVVAYEGNQRYLGAWRQRLDEACASIGLRFVVNPDDLREADVLVSFRDGKWDGWACRQWKSGVKHVNAIASGRPMVCQPSAAREETFPAGCLVTDAEQLTGRLKAVAFGDMREFAYQEHVERASDFTVQAIAKQYLGILQNVAVAA